MEARKPTGCPGVGMGRGGRRRGQQRGSVGFLHLHVDRVGVEPRVKEWIETCGHIQPADLTLPSGGQAVRWREHSETQHCPHHRRPLVKMNEWPRRTFTTRLQIPAPPLGGRPSQGGSAGAQDLQSQRVRRPRRAGAGVPVRRHPRARGKGLGSCRHLVPEL